MMNLDTELALPQKPRGALSLYVAGAVVLVLCALVAGLWQARYTRERLERAQRKVQVAAGVPVLVAPVVAAPVSEIIVVTGDVQPWRQVSVYPKLAGYLRALTVDRGDHVEAGQVIGFVEAPEADSELGSARADYRLRQQKLTRTHALRDVGAVSEQALDQSHAELVFARSELSRLQALHGYQTLRAPFSGTVIGRYVDPGALVSVPVGASQDGTPIIDIAEVERVRIRFRLGQREAALVSAGDAVQVLQDADPNTARTEKIARMTKALDSHSRTMLVELDADNSAGTLQLGGFVRAQFSLRMRPSCAVPAEAISVRDGETAVALVRDGRAEFVRVTTGDTDGRTVRLLSGASVGDWVALFPGDDIIHGARVRAIQRPR